MRVEALSWLLRIIAQRTGLNLSALALVLDEGGQFGLVFVAQLLDS